MGAGAMRVRGWASALGVLLALNGCLFPREEEPLAPPLVRPAEVTYRTVPAVRATIEQTVVVTGHITYRVQSAVAFERGGGRLRRIAVEFGEHVREGDLLAELRNDDLKVQVREREIALRKAELHQERARASGLNRFETELAALDVELAELHLKVARRDLLGTELRAPMDGIVTYTLPASPGDHLDPFVTVVRLADPDELVVEYRGAEAGRFELGVEVDLTVGAEQAQHRGHVIQSPRSVPAALLTQQPEARDLVHIRMLGPPPELYIGQSVRVVLTEERREDVVVIPRNLVRRYQDANYVYVLAGGEKLERSVEVGLVTGSQAEIVRGLEAAEQVIVR